METFSNAAGSFHSANQGADVVDRVGVEARVRLEWELGAAGLECVDHLPVIVSVASPVREASG